jgi:hypothetical protein
MEDSAAARKMAGMHDRLVHNAHRLVLKGPSRRERVTISDMVCTYCIVASDAIAFNHHFVGYQMRTTLDIDDEVLSAAKEIARRQRRTAGAVISELARRALTQTAPEQQAVAKPKPFYGFRPLAAERRVVSNETVERLREEEGI